MLPTAVKFPSSPSTTALTLALTDPGTVVNTQAVDSASSRPNSSAPHSAQQGPHPRFHAPNTSGLKTKLHELLGPEHLKKLKQLEKAKQLEQKFKQWLIAWKEELTASFSVSRANYLREMALKSNGDSGGINKLSKQWASLPPTLSHFGQKDSNWGNRLLRTLAHPKRLPLPGSDWVAVPVTTANTIKAEVDGILAQSGWKPVLGENIANSPRFQEIYPQMQEITPLLNEALKNARELHDEVQDLDPHDPAAFNELNSAYHTAMETLVAKSTEAYHLCTAHEMAAGLIYKASIGNAGILSHGIAHTIASSVTAIVAPIGLPVVSLAFDLAAEPTKRWDASRTDDIINRLNVQYATLAEGDEGEQLLRGLWESPLQRQVSLLEDVLSYETAREEDDAKQAVLQSELEHVQARTLDKLSPDSRAVELLLHKEAFRNAAYSARVATQLARRTGVNAAGSMVNTSVEAMGNITDDVFTTIAASSMETSVDLGETVAQYTADARADSPKSLDHESERDEEETNTAAQAESSSPSPIQRTQTWMSASSISSTMMDSAISMYEGVKDFSRFMADETKNAGMGVWSASTYKELLAIYQESAQFLKAVVGTASPR